MFPPPSAGPRGEPGVNYIQLGLCQAGCCLSPTVTSAPHHHFRCWEVFQQKTLKHGGRGKSIASRRTDGQFLSQGGASL